MMIKIQQGREEINSNGGTILTGALLRLNGWEKIDRMQSQRIKHGEIGHRDILKIAAALAYNCLRRIGQEALTCKEIWPVKIDVARRRLRSVLQDLIYVGCKFTRHANVFIVKFGRHCPWFKCFREVYAKC